MSWSARHLLLPLILALILTGHSEADLIERRKPQFQKGSGYYIVPMPYSLAGVGTGVVLLGAALNVRGTYTDVYGVAFAGDFEGAGVGVMDIHLIPERLILDADTESVSRASVTSYRQRGMETDKNDYTLLELGDIRFNIARLTSTFLDRRFEIYGIGSEAGSLLKRVRDQSGKVIVDTEDAKRGSSQTFTAGSRLDMTDDYQDARKGVRLDVSRSWSPPRGSSGPDYYIMDYNATAFVPVGKRNTWLFNVFRSDADVVRQGETERSRIEQEQGLNCGAIADPKGRTECDQVIDNIIAANRYGTVGSLGGHSRLRSYPHDRYKGAHSLFYGAEFRWNITEESRPFDILIMKDIRTVMQMAFFYETGSVSDRMGELGAVKRSSYGTGFRVVTASGLVFRADFATGSEGVSTTVIVGYPWETF